MINSVINHISFCMSMGNLDKIENPAPKEYSPTKNRNPVELFSPAL